MPISPLLQICHSSFLPVIAIKHSDQKQLRDRKGFFCLTSLDYSLSLRKVMEKSGGRTHREPGLLPHYPAHAQLACYTAQDHLPRNGATHSGLYPPPSINNQDNPLQTCP